MTPSSNTSTQAPSKRGPVLPEPGITLSEAARRFAALRRGPSRSTLSRDAAAGRLKPCQEPCIRTRPMYYFSALCALYGVDPDAPPGPAAVPTQSLAAQRAPAATGADLAAVTALQQQLEAVAERIEQAVAKLTRESRELQEIKRTLMLKYDAENGLLRARAQDAEERLRQGAGLETLTREVSAARQGVARMTQTFQERWPGA